MNPETDLSADQSEISRVREARHRISERFDHDPHRLVAYYVKQQARHADRLVKAPALIPAGDTVSVDR